jgi:hypothetical protein
MWREFTVEHDRSGATCGGIGAAGAEPDGDPVYRAHERHLGNPDVYCLPELFAELGKAGTGK